jgi:hypothetical protein
VSRESYVAPVIVESYLAGSLPPGRARTSDRPEQPPLTFGRREELALVSFLERTGSTTVTTRKATRRRELRPRPQRDA